MDVCGIYENIAILQTKVAQKFFVNHFTLFIMKNACYWAVMLTLSLAATTYPLFAQKPACLPQKRYENGQMTHQYRYDAAGNLQAMEEYKGDVLKSRGTSERIDAEGRILEARVLDELEKTETVLKYIRDAKGYVTTLEVWRGKDGQTPTLFRRNVYENDPKSAGVLSKITKYDGAGVFLGTTAIENLDANGSSKSVLTDAKGTVTQTEVWMRDDKQAPEQVTQAFTYQWAHNRTTQTITKADGTVDGSSYQYENAVYNEHGFLVSCTIRYTNGRTTQLKWEYACRQ